MGPVDAGILGSVLRSLGSAFAGADRMNDGEWVPKSGNLEEEMGPNGEVQVIKRAATGLAGVNWFSNTNSSNTKCSEVLFGLGQMQ